MAYDENNIEKTVQIWVKKVERALAHYEQVSPKSVRLSLSREDEWLFLRWKSWSVRYAVSADFMLTTLLDHFNRIRKSSSASISLGVSVPLLTCPRAHEIITTAVAAAFPNGENLDVQRYENAQRILKKRMREYREHVRKKQALASQIAKEEKRGSGWIRT